LVDKEIRKYVEKGVTKIPSELGEANQTAIKNYVKDYLGRHDVKIE
jgi:hypothetical protein